MSAKPIPKPTPETEPFWAGCAAGELRLQRCNSCSHVQYPARKLCSSCFSQDVIWQKGSGLGTIRSWSTVVAPGAPGFTDEVPFLSVLVELNEGPTMLSVLRECSAEEVDFGMPVEVIFEARSETISIPYFKPQDRKP